MSLGNSYNIYKQPNEPAGCMYTHLKKWLHVMETQLHRPLTPDDYVFPSIAKDDRIKVGKQTSIMPTQYFVELTIH